MVVGRGTVRECPLEISYNPLNLYAGTRVWLIQTSSVVLHTGDRKCKSDVQCTVESIPRTSIRIWLRREVDTIEMEYMVEVIT